MVVWLIAMLAGGMAATGAPNAATAVVPTSRRLQATPPVLGPVLKPPRKTGRALHGGSQRLSALALPGDGTETRATPFSFSAMEDERQRLRLGVKPGLRRARVGVDYRVALDR